MAVILRPMQAEDWPTLWDQIIRPVIRAGDTYTLPVEMNEADARAYWERSAPWRVVVAELDGQILGTGKTGPNQQGPGARIANGSYMVGAAARGRGVGRALVEDSLSWAKAQGYRGVQFNAVAESNRGAVRLYRDLGFDLIGTIPNGFDHPGEGPVGLHIMYHRF